MWVKDYMCAWVNTITPDKTLGDAIKQMVEKKTNSMIVVDEENKPVGVISSHSIIKEVVPEYLRKDLISAQFDAEGTFDKYAISSKDKLIGDIMFTDINVLSIDDAMIEAAAYVSKGARRILPVVDKEGKLAGAITRTCVKLALYNAIFKESKVDPQGNNCPTPVK